MTAMTIDKPRGRAWWKELWIQVLIAMAAGMALGIAGAAFVVLAATLSATGSIPVTSVALVLGIHRLMSQGLTPTNLIGNAVATIAIAKWEGALDRERLKRVLDGEEPETAAAG